MLNRSTIMPLFVKLTRIDRDVDAKSKDGGVWINVGNVNEILVYGGKTVIVYAEGDVRYVKESPEEIIEKLKKLQ